MVADTSPRTGEERIELDPDISSRTNEERVHLDHEISSRTNEERIHLAPDISPATNEEMIHLSPDIPPRTEERIHLDPAQVKKHFDRIGRFRILVIGRSNAGKTTLLQRVCNTTELPEIFNAKGEKVKHFILLHRAFLQGANTCQFQQGRLILWLSRGPWR